ncbi:hypothetical protein FOZ62_008775, partial [Perkinsus olseni]
CSDRMRSEIATGHGVKCRSSRKSASYWSSQMENKDSISLHRHFAPIEMAIADFTSKSHVDGEDSLKGALGKALTPGSGWAAGMSGISSRKLKCKKAIEEITKKLRKGDPELNLRAGPVCAGCVNPEEYFVERVCDMAYSLSLKQEEPSSTTEQPEVPAETIGVAEEEAQGSTQEE